MHPRPPASDSASVSEPPTWIAEQERPTACCHVDGAESEAAWPSRSSRYRGEGIVPWVAGIGVGGVLGGLVASLRPSIVPRAEAEGGVASKV